MYDNHSTDNSKEIAKALGMEVRTFGEVGVLNDADYLKVKDNCWKEARGEADFVIVCDADEFLYHSEMIERLRSYHQRGVSLPRTQGYDMISDQLPVNDMFEVITGFKRDIYSKPIIFSPNLIDEIHLNYGGHRHQPRGVIKRSYRRLGLYHFRMIGGLGRLLSRHEEYMIRISDFNKEMGFGKHYWVDREAKVREWNKNMKKAKVLTFAK